MRNDGSRAADCCQWLALHAAMVGKIQDRPDARLGLTGCRDVLVVTSTPPSENSFL
jgi:hypothetical protein